MSLSESTRSISSVSVDSGSLRSYASSESSGSSTPAQDFRSSGRGGSGNIRRKSSVPQSPLEQDALEDAPEVPVSPAGRERPTISIGKAIVGRGGAGNVHFSWRDQVHEGLTQTASILAEHAATVAQYEQAVIQKRMEERDAGAVSSGRGGSGNITKLNLSLSKSKVKGSSLSTKSKLFRFSHSRSEGNLRRSPNPSYQSVSSDADSTLDGGGTPSHE
ncbi:hypothetical protein NEOLEDRAFT_1144774 [Neolentinus lepideus HHB14362 ss-1]|uniref:Uncharacterized protein n=1 Tax=Neolentinus lepideus HHB14362 ss-1 TaxID=1314782 RepID=A0A165VGM1_9AGAM|nr:hypothetical protein NEOLEDRAFT_1144774 [Neolentinus lepideus HHB14362 ss-1]